jgi:branched-chain amino acid transport system substrate-binding protein
MKGEYGMKRLNLLWMLFAAVLFFGVVSLWGAQKRVIKIAFLGPISGANAEIGLSARNCYDLAIKQANASGKYNFVIEPLVLDDESNPAVGVAAALKAVSDPQVVAATGHYNSPVALATIHVFHEAGIPLALWGTVSPEITSKYNFPEVTRVVPTLETQSKIAADFVLKKVYKNWAVINDTTDFGVASKDTFVKSVKALGGQILSTDGITTGTTDFRPVLTKIKGMKDVQGIYVGTVAMEGALIRNQMIKLGMNDLITMGNTGIANETFNKVAGPAAEGSLCTSWTNPHQTKKGRKLYEEYKANYKETFNETNGPAAYDATNIIIECLKKVGLDDKKALVRAIRNIKYNGAFGETAFDEFGQTKFGGIIIYVSQNGTWQPWSTSDYATGKKKLPKK